ILGSNTETGDVKLIYENNTLGYPNYSSKDNQLVFDNDGSGTTINTGLVILNNNKIESASVPVLFISNSRWAVWFSNGKRVLSSSEETSSGLGSGIKLKSNPVHAEVEIEFNTVINEHPLIKITNTLGQVIYQNTHFISSDKTNILINSDHWLPDTYFLNVTINDKTVSIPFIKM
ncbi:MAG: T9SS type A sorting domain-containing protein, partial [Saprospiraceae bacterium]|nr:T9SS type A sorting domain-containing protein [Saprospiraceae bacterium]